MDAHDVVGHRDVLFVTLDCLRLDVARACLARGDTPNLAAVLPHGGWEARETPGTFTLPAHLAFFHGFLPTPLTPGPHPRLFALEFDGSLSTSETTFVFTGVDNVIDGFHAHGYRSFCVGGVGFFNKKNPLGHVLPGYFQESVWSPALGVTAKDSTAAEACAGVEWLEGVPAERRALLFVNVSATHPPHGHYLEAPPHPPAPSPTRGEGEPETSLTRPESVPLNHSPLSPPLPSWERGPGGEGADCVESQMAALAYVDSCLPPLFAALRRRGGCFCLFMADHGEAHGEDGRFGHRIAHPSVTTVPYAHFFLS